MTRDERIAEFEERTGLTFSEDGPELEECEGCGEDLQFVPDHECAYSRALNAEARHYEEAMHGGRDEWHEPERFRHEE